MIRWQVVDYSTLWVQIGLNEYWLEPEMSRTKLRWKILYRRVPRTLEEPSYWREVGVFDSLLDVNSFMKEIEDPGEDE